MYLLLDLSVNDTIHVALFNESEVKDHHVAGINRDLLATVVDFLTQEGMSTKDVQGIATVVGAGGFTSTRIGAIIANVFGYSQKIPVLGIAAEEMTDLPAVATKLSAKATNQYVSASYSAEPNIGKKK